MKRILFFAIIAALVTSCASPDPKMESLETKRDSIKKLHGELGIQLSDLELQISELDTSTEKRLATVSSMDLSYGRFEHFFEVQGSVETDKNAQIFPEAQGRITSIKVKEGQPVKAGQILMVIDNKVMMNSIQELESQFELAETVYKKQKNLWSQKIGSEIQYLEAKTNRDALERKLETMRSQLDMYNVKAAFSGVVDEVFPKEGEMAGPGMPAFRLLNLDKVYIKADVSESYLGKIKTGDSVRVSFPSLGQSMWTTIDRMGSFINPNNRTFKLRLNIDNSGGLLKPNLLGEILIRDYRADSTLTLPSSIVQQNPQGEEFVYVLGQKGESGHYMVSQKMITTGMAYEGDVEVMSGLMGNDQVVTKGARFIKDGEWVSVKN